MYAGRAVEQAPVAELFARPRHPYTLGLMRALPAAAMTDPGGGGNPPGGRERHGRRRLAEIPGMVPFPHSDPDECAFHPRCPRAQADCSASRPELVQQDSTGPHVAACFHPLREHP
jgi:oligopeptide/dipeptide ABC transporter ATP-binding protein